jgi:hypothetical protein
MNKAQDIYLKERHDEAYEQIARAIPKLHPKYQNSKGYLRFEGYLKFDENMPGGILHPYKISFDIKPPKKFKKL